MSAEKKTLQEQEKLDDLPYIEESTNLKKIAPAALTALRRSCNNDNKYAAYLSILVDGYAPRDNYTFNFEKGSSYTVKQADYDYVITTLRTLVFNQINEKTKIEEQKTFASVIEQTPGWKLLNNNGEFANPVGWSGVGSLAS